MSNTPSGEFGGAIQEALDAVVASGVSAISIADAGSKLEFLDFWTRALIQYAKHLKSDNTALLAPAALVHVEDCASFAALGWKRRPMLGLSPMDKYSGMLIVGTTSFGGFVHPQTFVNTDEICDEIERLGLGGSLTVALTSVDSLAIWGNGLLNTLRPSIRSLSGEAMVLNRIVKDLEIFYEEEARQSTKWWKDASKRITVDRPEQAVQDALRVFLIGRYAEVAKVREELVSGNGRTDITIRPLAVGESAVLELKTTRDVRTPKRAEKDPIKVPLKTNVRWVRSGVQQAAAYRDHEGFSSAILCVYDFCAQQGVGLDEAIEKMIKAYNVTAKRYWIAASHQEHRDERYPIV